MVRFQGKGIILRAVLVFVTGVGLSLPAWAQSGMSPEEWASLSAAKLNTTVKLTEEQSNQIRAIHRRIFHRAEQVQNTNTENKSKSSRLIRRILQDRENELKKILRPDQWRKLQLTRLEQSIRFRTDMMTLVLQLTEEQARGVDEITQEAFRKVQEAQKTLLANKLKMIEAVRTIQEEREKELEETLSIDQWNTYKEIRREIPDFFHPKTVDPKKGREGIRQFGQNAGEPKNE